MAVCEVGVLTLNPTHQTNHPSFADEQSKQENDIGHEKWCNDLAAQLLCVFVLDRFGDFVSDQVR